MAKKANPTPSRTCADCFHFSACHLWAVAISTDVAPQCPQFEPARYASLADLHEMHQMAKGELVPVVHGRWESCYEDWRHQLEGNKCSVCGFEYFGNLFKFCPNCGAKMDGGSGDV